MKPHSDAISALSLPNVIEQDQVAKYVAMYQQVPRDGWIVISYCARD